jgi:hypothetical protein
VQAVSSRFFSIVASFAAAFAMCAIAAAAMPTVPVAGATDYCDIIVPATTDCANVAGGSYVNGHFKNNAAEVPGSSGSVCEHTYKAGSGTTVSDRCASNFVNSSCDLSHLTYELSGHAGNNSSGPLYVEGFTGSLEIECS